LYVGINPPLEYNGPAYLGDAYSPFTVNGDPNLPTFSVPNIGLSDQGEIVVSVDEHHCVKTWTRWNEHSIARANWVRWISSKSRP
jgi:hypothetical protein